VRVFVPGRLTNPLNGPHGHWTKHRRWARTWRDATCMRILEAYNRQPIYDATVPKQVTFTLYVARLFDCDAAPATVKSCRDALIDMRVIHGDSPTHGHSFVYRQVVSPPTKRGVEIHVAVLPKEAA
jgi:hypothetical protein